MYNSLLAQLSIHRRVFTLYQSVGDGLSAHTAQAVHETFSLSPEIGSDFLNFLATGAQPCFMKCKCLWISLGFGSVP